MTYNDVLEQARGQMGPCKACPVCDGRGCRGTIPAPAPKAWVTPPSATTRPGKPCASRWIPSAPAASRIPAAHCSDIAFGCRFLPALSGLYSCITAANTMTLPTTISSYRLAGTPGILAFTGDGTNPAVMEAACGAVKAADGFGIPTVKPWDADTIDKKMALVRASKAFAVAMDIDAAGLPFLKNLNPPAGSKTVEELAQIISDANVPFLVKGIMTARGAEKAIQAGAAGIVVSNHGGRVLDGTPATAEVLPEIAAAVNGRALVLVDGGIRSGLDVFRALALGADAVLIARPFVTAVYGGGAAGVQAYVDQLQAELADTMTMCGAHTLAEISRDMVRL